MIGPQECILLTLFLVPLACVIAVRVSPAPEQAMPASGVRRLGAAWLDGLLLALVLVPVAIAAEVQIRAAYPPVLRMTASQLDRFIRSMMLLQLGLFLAQLLGGWLYAALLESSSAQATLGKRAMGVRVVGPDGGRISFLRATGRHFAKHLVLAAGLALLLLLLLAVPPDRRANEPPAWLGLGMLAVGLAWIAGFAVIPFNREKRGLHDWLSGTRAVVPAPERLRPLPTRAELFPDDRIQA